MWVWVLGSQGLEFDVLGGFAAAVDTFAGGPISCYSSSGVEAVRRLTPKLKILMLRLQCLVCQIGSLGDLLGLWIV